MNCIVKQDGMPLGVGRRVIQTCRYGLVSEDVIFSSTYHCALRSIKYSSEDLVEPSSHRINSSYSTALFSLFITSTMAATVRQIYEFPKPTWLENVDTMRNGSFLVSVIGRAEVHIVKPGPVNATSSLVASLPNANAVLGITELSEDIFVVAAGNLTPTNSPITGTFVLWKLDFTHESDVKVEKVADMPKVDMVNGIEAINHHTVLLADSWAGNIVAVDTKTGKYEVALEDASLLADFNDKALPLGVNGIKYHDGHVYYSNTVLRLIGRVPVDHSGKATGAFKILASGTAISVPDDLAVAKDGSVYFAGPLAAPNGDTLQHLTLDGRVTTIAKGGPVAGSTAVRFGKTPHDRDTVYLSTMGGFGADGAPAAGGRVVAVDLSQSC